MARVKIGDLHNDKGIECLEVTSGLKAGERVLAKGAILIKPIVVHGGGKAITRAMDGSGVKANFIQGMRVTDDATVKVAAAFG